nr:MAG TPA: hypothetical protein [Bacteriophage sp.]
MDRCVTSAIITQALHCLSPFCKRQIRGMSGSGKLYIGQRSIKSYI